MKKVIVLSLGLLLCLTMVACKNSNDTSSKNNEITSEIISSNHDSKTDAKSSFTNLSLTTKSGLVFNYYLYTPKNVKDNMPLILYLHGGSGKPTTQEGDLTLLTAGDGLPKFIKDKQAEVDSYILFPQLPYGKKGWSDVKTDLLEFLNKETSLLEVDSTKVSITGHSMGGKGAWDISLAYPSTFYKVAALSGNVTTNDLNLNKFKDKEVWAIVGSEDTIVDPQSSIDFITELQKTNDKAKLTVIDGYGHFDVPNAYLSTEYDLLNWLIK